MAQLRIRTPLLATLLVVAGCQPSVTASPTAASSVAPSGAPSPSGSSLSLASLLSGPLPTLSQAEATAAISAVFAAHPQVAAAVLNGSTTFPLASATPVPWCFAIHDVKTYEASAPQCLVSFQALQQAYQMSADLGFMNAARGLLGAIQGSTPTDLFPRFEHDLQGLSNYLESNPPLPSM